MRDKVVKVCLSLVLACTLVVSPFVKAEKAYAVVPAVAAAASAWGVSEGAVVAAVSAMAAACGVTWISSTETGYDWDKLKDECLILNEAESIVDAAIKENGGSPNPQKNNGGGNFLECVKQLAVVGAISGVGSAVNAGVNFLLDKLFPLPDFSGSLGTAFTSSVYLNGWSVPIPFSSLPDGIGWDDDSSWYAYRYYPDGNTLGNGQAYNIVVCVANELCTVNSVTTSNSVPAWSLTHSKIPGSTYFYYNNGAYVASLNYSYSFTINNEAFENPVYLNPNFSYGYEFVHKTSSGTVQSGVFEGDFSNTVKLDDSYEIANLPPDLLDSINAAATAATNAANRSQALADATQAVLDNLASTGSSIQTTPSTSNDRDDYVTPNPTVEPVKPTEPVDPDAPFDWSQFLQPDLYLVFPFCLPWDIYELVSLLSTSAEAPVFDLPLKVPLEGGDYSVHIDLSVFDPVAEVARAMELLAVAAGLIFLTKKMIEN